MPDASSWLCRADPGAPFALQVQSDHYEDFFAPELKKHGYAAVYKKKTGEVSQVSKQPPHHPLSP